MKIRSSFLILFFFCLVNFPSAFSQLQSTVWRRATNTHLPNEWTNPQYANGSDDFYAEVLHQSGCRCPFLDLSWDDGINYSNANLFGPYSEVDSYQIKGDSLDDWGHSWLDSEFSDSTFVLRIWNSSTLLKQGYSNFGFGIPGGSTISGIEVSVEAHGDSSFTYDFVDDIEARVYYYLPTAINEAYSSSRNIYVYPNPAHDIIHLRFTDEGNRSIKIYNVQGEVVAENIFESVMPGHDLTLNVGNVSPGIYFVEAANAQRTINTRIVIQ
jgi:hypothetical protein